MSDLIKRLRKHGGKGFVIGNEAADALERAEQEVASLRAELIAYKAVVECSHEAIPEAQCIGDIPGHIKELRADAERLDWCDKQWANGIHVEVYAKTIRPECYEPQSTVFTRHGEHRDKDIRAVIDRARQNAGEQE